MGLFWLIWDQAPSMSLADQLRKIQGANKEKVEADAPSSSSLALFNGQSTTEPTTRKRTRNSLEEEPAAPPTKKLRHQTAPVEEDSSSDEESSQEEEEEEPSSSAEIDQEESHEEPLADAPEATEPEAKLSEEEEAAQKVARRERDQRTLFLGNLPTNTKKKDLRALCITYGKIESVRFRSVPVASPKLPKKVSFITKQFSEKLDDLHAYVVFMTPAEAIKAQALNGTVFRERHLRADVSSNERKKLDNDCSVFVGNLSYEVTDEALWAHFADCGEVKAVRVVRDPQYRIGKGFGYVMFDTPLAVNRALKLDTKKMDGRALRVSRAVRNKAKQTPAGKEKKGGPRGQRQAGKHKGQTGSFIQVAKARDQAPAKKKKKTSLTPSSDGAKSFEGKRAVPGKAPRFTLPNWKKEEKKKQHSGPRKPRHKKTKNKT